MSRVVSALDAHVEAIRRATGGPVPQLNPGRPREVVRRILAELVEDPVDDLVDLWSWHDGEAGPASTLFWTGGGAFYSLDRIMADLPMIRESVADDRAWFEAEGFDWPYGPDDVVPVLSTGELTLVDSGSSARRGRVYLHPAPSDAEPAFEMFPSLADAIDAARFCVEAGYWVPEIVDGVIQNMSVPGRDNCVSRWDLTSPPFLIGPAPSSGP